MRDDDNDDHATLAALAVKVARLELEVDRLETRFVTLARYLNVERAVLGLVTLVLSLLVTYAFNHMIGVR